MPATIPTTISAPRAAPPKPPPPKPSPPQQAPSRLDAAGRERAKAQLRELGHTSSKDGVRAFQKQNGALAADSFWDRLFGRNRGATDRSGVPRGRTPAALNQFDGANLRLGRGSKTIAESGCLLSSLGMTSMAINGTRGLDLKTANARVLANNGFSGSGLRMERAAPALGLEMTDRRLFSPSAVNRMDAELAAGRPVIAGVDLGPGRSSGASEADHFIMVYGRTRDGYLAMDPAGGQVVRLGRNADGGLSYAGAPSRRLTEMISFRPAS